MDRITTDLLRDWAWWIAGGVVVLLLLVLLIFFYRSKDEVPATRPEIEVPQVDVEPEPDTEPQHPLPPVEDEATADEAEPLPPLPPLDESDESITGALADAIGVEAVKRHLIEENIIPSIVVTIDNLARDELALRLRAVTPVQGQFSPSVQEGEFEPGEEEYELREEDFERYEAAVKLVESTDTEDIVALYRRYYPLFQTAYADLGYPAQYFNDRLVEVIDHLLDAPEVEPPIELTRPFVLYEFADPSLEGRSAGQKILIRMGPDNAAAIKEKLREIREAVSTTTPVDAS
ncbi:MAG: DUF3014 domain-containing protein [Gammaproteobacteria bacterium]|nr:DUF3014 domain-containing protein [Gammaproteobacteria bacterium]